MLCQRSIRNTSLNTKIQMNKAYIFDLKKCTQCNFCGIPFSTIGLFLLNRTCIIPNHYYIRILLLASVITTRSRSVIVKKPFIKVFMISKQSQHNMWLSSAYSTRTRTYHSEFFLFRSEHRAIKCLRLVRYLAIALVSLQVIFIVVMSCDIP